MSHRSPVSSEMIDGPFRTTMSVYGGCTEYAAAHACSWLASQHAFAADSIVGVLQDNNASLSSI